MKTVFLLEDDFFRSLRQEDQENLRRALRRFFKKEGWVIAEKEQDADCLLSYRFSLKKDRDLAAALRRGEGKESDSSPLLPSEEEILAARLRLGQLNLLSKERLVGAESFFGPGPASLLRAIDETGNVRQACKDFGLSYSKAWKMLARIDRALGRSCVLRRQGGSCGGRTELSRDGRALLDCYEKISASLAAYCDAFFETHFPYDLMATPFLGDESASLSSEDTPALEDTEPASPCETPPAR